MPKAIDLVRWCSALAALLSSFVAPTPAGAEPPPLGALRASDLRCEWAIDPIGLGEREPRLAWIVASDRRGERQTAYRILVASTPEALAAERGDLWDSGRVESSATLAIYAGAPLGSRRVCHWMVRAWDRDGVAGPWSDPARWEMGLLDEGDWIARWIDASPMADPAAPAPRVLRAVYLPASAVLDHADWSAIPRSALVTDIVRDAIARGGAIAATNAALGGDPAKDTLKRLVVEYESGGATLRREAMEGQELRLGAARLPLLRATFTLDRPVRSARLHATALGLYEARINGELVGDLALSPGWTDYRRRVHRQTYDVTELLRAGANAIGAMVAPGWFSGRAGLFHARAFYGSAPAFACQLEIDFTDGSSMFVATDDAWTRRAGPIVSSDIMEGEEYDARAEIDGWCEPGAAEGWSPVLLRDESRVVESSIDHTVRTLAELPARSVAEPAPGRFVFDLGQNMVGVARLRLREPAGTVVTIRHAEILLPDGSIDVSNLRGAPSVDTYICRGGGEEIWLPRFTFHGFRFVEISGIARPAEGLPPLEMVTGVVIGSDLPTTGTFSAFDPDLTRLHENIVWGLRGNAVSIPTDCPQRDERMGWTGDVQAFAATGTLVADMTRFLEKWLVDLEDAQREDGAHSDVAPVMRGLSYGTPGWGDAGTVVPWELHRRTGDRRILERSVGSMMRWVDWCEANSEGLLRVRHRGNDYGDWLSVDAPTPKDLIGTAFFAHSASLTARSLRALGRDEDAARYEALFERIRAAFAAAYIDGEGRIAGETQTGYALALRFGLVPTELRERAVAHLVAAIEARDGRLSTGFLGSGHLLPALDEGGRGDVALRLLLQRAWPSWLFAVRHGATTIWERWDGWTPERGAHPDISMNSFNHFAFGSCGEWLYGGVAGIAQAPDDIGFERIVVRPRVDGPLVAASADYRSVRGTIASAWRRRGAELALSVTIPANAVARVHLPASRDADPRESGLSLDEAEGVSIVERTDDAVILEIGSGRYEFASRIALPTSGNPIVDGRYADPDAILVDGRAWIYPTTSAPYDDQLHLDAFSSEDLVHWTRHPRVLDRANVSWLRRALWAPSAIEKDGRFYLFFSANDIQKEGEVGGIGVAVSDRPDGPFRDLLGRPLVGSFHHGAQPIDPFVFRDDDGRHYLIHGGWGRCVIARLRDDFTGFEPLDPAEPATIFREITPEGYVEGPCMFRRKGKVYFMWSEGGWTGPDYAVAYAIADAPTGPFVRAGRILAQDPTIATGAGHHSVLALPERDEHVIVYHRRPLGMTDRNDRVVCIDELRFDDEGRILPVRMTEEGVEARGLGRTHSSESRPSHQPK